MAATRLSDSQKTELVERFRGGASSQELAEAYGCSANTVSRVVRMVLGEEDYERIKRQRARRRLPTAGPALTPEIDQPAPADAHLILVPSAPVESLAAAVSLKDVEEVDGPAVLAIDDADDFGTDDEDDLLTEEEDGADDEINPFQPIAVELMHVEPAAGDGQLQPLATASLASSAYMLVEKTVELQARPLHEFPELGRLPAEELERQALVVFLNPRQAKRQCGRNQRVIKVPDLRVLERTAPYLLAQGISRVVIEGALYALPGS
jgi:hypothetical protein